MLTIKLLLIIFMLSYCDGWKLGYERGYCYGDVNCITPIVPPCPVPKVNFTSYRDGYERGFVEGKKKRNGQQTSNTPANQSVRARFGR